MVSGYQEAREAAAFDERRDRGRVLLTGAGAKSFLHALLTNDIASLAPGTGCYAALLTPQGRMITDMDVIAGSDAAGVLLIVPSDVAPALAVRLDTSIFTEEVEVADVSTATSHFSVTGPGAAAAADRAIAAIGGEAVAVRLAPAYGNEAVPAAGPHGRVWRSSELGVDGFDLVVALEHAGAVRQALAGRAAALSPDARRTLRIEAGRPEFHVDMTDATIPLEAGLLERAISTTKGCYVGQEVIIRVLHRGGGRVAKRLVRLRFDDPSQQVPAAGAALFDGGREAGRVTSAVWSPRDAAPIGLGYVHRDVAHDGATLTLAGGGTALVTGV